MKTLTHKHDRFSHTEFKANFFKFAGIAWFIILFVFSRTALFADDPTPAPTPYPAPQVQRAMNETNPTVEYNATNASTEMQVSETADNHPPEGPSHRDTMSVSVSQHMVSIPLNQITDADNDPLYLQTNFNGAASLDYFDPVNRVAHVYFNFSQLEETAEAVFTIRDLYPGTQESFKSAGFIYIVTIVGDQP